MKRVERLVRYLIDFALDEKYEISIPKGDIDSEIKVIHIDLVKKEIQIDP